MTRSICGSLRRKAKELADQNRLYGGLILYLDEKRLWRLETGYMLQSTFTRPTTLKVESESITLSGSQLPRMLRFARKDNTAT